MQDSVLHGSHNIPMLRCRDIQRPSKACCEPVLASRCLSNPATLQITALPRLRQRLTMRSSPSEYPDFASAPHPSPDIPASSAERYCSIRAIAEHFILPQASVRRIGEETCSLCSNDVQSSQGCTITQPATAKVPCPGLGSSGAVLCRIQH